MSSWLCVLIIVAPAEPEIKSFDKKQEINLSVSSLLCYSCSLLCALSPPTLSRFVLDRPYCCFIVTDDENAFWHPSKHMNKASRKDTNFLTQSIKTDFMHSIVSSWFCVFQCFQPPVVISVVLTSVYMCIN